MVQPSLNSLDACIPEHNATVSASAGSGKTWLLVTRIIRLLLAGAEPGNIIALTFTRKAAGEMQIRLNQRLYDMATADDVTLSQMLAQIGCEDNADNRQRARALYENLVLHLYPVRLQTFHSFCQDILSRFPLEADIPPGFTLTEDTSLISLQAWQMLFDQANQKAGPASEALSAALDTIMDACNGPENTRAALNSFLDQRCEWWAYTGNSHQVVKTACDRLNHQLELETFQPDDDIDVAIRQFFNDIQIARLKRFHPLLIETAGKKNIEAAAKLQTAVDCLPVPPTTDITTIESIYRDIRSAFITQSGTPIVQGRTLNDSLRKKLGDSKAEQFIEMHEQVSDALLDCDEQIKRLNSRKINFAWYLAGHRYIELFQQLKSDMRLLDFNDLEWKTYRLLQHSDNAHWVQYKIDQRIDHILIDEFQDTNPTQWQLLLPLLEEIAASQHDRLRSVFLVGDEKQSIYSFRRANPELQAEASGWLHQHMNASAVPLDFSRRSSPAIIECVNRVFEQDHIHGLMHGFTHHGTHLSTLPGHVEIMDLFSLGEDNDTETQAVYFRNPLIQPRIIDTTTARHLEAEHIARQIIQMIEQSWTITDAEANTGTGLRPVEFRDFMILTRYRTHIDIYEQALKNHAIPFIGSKKGGLLDSLEIQDLRCLLEVLVVPFNNLTLAQLLKSPIFDASEHDLEQLARVTGNRYWFYRLTESAQTGSTGDIDRPELSAKLKRAARLLLSWQQYADHLPVHDCLDRIFHEGNIIARYQSACRNSNANSVTANCQRFLELSLETDSGRYPGIARFLQRLQHIENYSDSPPEEPLPEGESNRVRVMTVHASKGLEAPVVFLVDSNSADNSRNAYKTLVDWPAKNQRPVSFQLQLSSKKTDAITEALQRKKELDKKREELNLLYVAITRARQALFISGAATRTKDNPDSGYQIIANALSDCEQQTGSDNYTSRILTYDSLQPDTSEPGRAENDNAPDANTISIGDTDRSLHNSRLSAPPEPGMLQLNNNWRMIAPSQSETGKYRDTGFTIDADAQLAKWRGITIHKILELLSCSGSYPATADTIRAPLQSLYAETQREYPEYAHHIENCLQEALANHNDPGLSIIFQRTDDSQHFSEMPVLYADAQGVVVKGYMDHVIRREGEVTIIDYKSHFVSVGQPLDELVDSFRSQLEYYRHGAQKLWPADKIKTGILFTHTQHLVWVDES